jgi:hypothetical protein
LDRKRNWRHTWRGEYFSTNFVASSSREVNKNTLVQISASKKSWGAPPKTGKRQKWKLESVRQQIDFCILL